MDLDQLKEQYEQDITWEFTQIPVYASTIPLKIAKYQKMWMDLRNQHDKYEKQYNDLWIKRFMWYKQEFDISLSNTEIKVFLEKDTELNDIRAKQKKLMVILEWLEKAMKNLDSIRWDIKNVIEYQKFISGVI